MSKRQISEGATYNVLTLRVPQLSDRNCKAHSQKDLNILSFKTYCFFTYRLEQRTRSSLLANLYQDLTAMTTQYLGIPEYPTDVSGSGAETTGRNKPQSSSTIIESVKRALSSKSKLESATNGNSSGGGMLTSHREHIRLSKSKSTLGKSAF
jgi:hypothetical protein